MLFGTVDQAQIPESQDRSRPQSLGRVKGLSTRLFVFGFRSYAYTRSRTGFLRPYKFVLYFETRRAVTLRGVACGFRQAGLTRGEPRPRAQPRMQALHNLSKDSLIALVRELRGRLASIRRLGAQRHRSGQTKRARPRLHCRQAFKVLENSGIPALIYDTEGKLRLLAANAAMSHRFRVHAGRNSKHAIGRSAGARGS